ncbi:MAG TPA: TIGR03668 family PPOX class F420-dependent oxidoreductase [Thermodesulfobacteriota bacterium]|jgi:PPOX class probable F420-dependent enzyme
MTNSRVLPTEREYIFIQSQRIARMATVDRSGKPLVLPICYAYDGTNLYTPIDKKPKSVSPGELKRIRNITGNPNVSVLVDVYNEDWNEIGFIIIHGTAEVIDSGKEYRESLRILSEKYIQYRQMNLSELGLPVIKISPNRIISWGKI